MGIFQNYIKPYDIICISETKQNYIDKHEFKGYESFCHTGGGIYGIAILVKNHLCREIELSKNVGSKNVLWLYIKSLDITIGAVYIPPENSINSDNDVYMM